jgi:predicted thioesterase
MLAVNHPNVVLGSSEVRFLKPVVIGDTVTVQADVTSLEGKKHKVTVVVKRGDDIMFEGVFTCFVPSKHVLAP